MHLQRTIVSWSIRRKLTLLILAVFLPAAGIIVYQNVGERRQALSNGARYATAMVESLAAQQGRVESGTKQLLSTLATLPEVESLKIRACNDVFLKIISHFKYYSNIALDTPDGNMVAGAQPFKPGSVNLSDRLHFKEAVKELDFAAGEYAIGKTSKIPSIHFAYPVLGANNRLVAVITAGFKLTEYDSFIRKVNLPPDSEVAILDYKGVRLYRFPESSTSPLGKQVTVESERMKVLNEGGFERMCDDGIYRIFAFKRLSISAGSPPYMLIMVGVSKSRIVQRANSAMILNLSILVLAAGILLSFAWFLGNVAFALPIKKLVDAANKFAEGNMSARSGLSHTPDELGKLAQSFDNMAELLQKKALEKEQAEEELLRAHRHIQLILNTAQEGIVGLDKKGSVTFANAAALEMLGYEERELIGRDFHPAVHHSFPDGTRYPEAQCPMSNCLVGGPSCQVRDEFFWKKDGTGFPAAYTTAPIMENGQIVGAVGTFRDISVRKRAEQTLRESEHKFKSFSEHAVSGVYLIQDGVFKYVNPRFAEMFGYTVEELQDVMEFKHLVYAQDLANVEEQVGKRISGQAESVHYTFRGLRKNGEVFHVEIYGSGTFHNGKPAALGNILDITERKRAEEAVRRSEREKTMLNRIFDVFLTISDEKIYEEVLKVILDAFKCRYGLFGYIGDEGELIVPSLSTGAWSECHVEEKSTVFPHHAWGNSMWGKSITEKKSFLSEGPFQTPKGHMVVHNFLSVPILINNKTIGLAALANKDGGFTGEDKAVLELIVERISPILHTRMQRDKQELEREKAEEALRESEERYRQLFNNIKDAVFVHLFSEQRIPGHFIEVNEVACKMLGYTREELLRMTPLDIDAPDTRALIPPIMEELYQNGHALWEGAHMTRDGRRIPVEISNRLFDLRGVPMILATVRDITERKKADEEREKLQAQLNQAQKMESIGRLAGGVAHDFNNKLSVILGHAELAMEQVDQAHELFESLKEIETAALQSADLTRQLLAFARRQTISPKILDLNETVEGMLKMLRRLIGEDIELAWLPGKSLYPVKIDPSQIDQILANLCVNGRDAIAGVGKITIESANTVFENAYCALHPGFEPGVFIMLAVSDNGSGMDKETRNKIFEPFFTTKVLGKGTGLGLATVYGIVKQNNGFINVYSEVGQGTTFKIYLPRAEEQPAEKPAVYLKRNLRGKETVLLVEDEESILALGKTILERHGYEVLASKNPNEALGMAQSYPGPIHLLITDVVMPEMNGKDLIRRLVEVKPGLKSIFMSGYTANVIAHHGILDEGINFLQKPFSVQSLLEKVRDVLER